MTSIINCVSVHYCNGREK